MKSSAIEILKDCFDGAISEITMGEGNSNGRIVAGNTVYPIINDTPSFLGGGYKE